MGIEFSANDVLLMAERIERNGARFYRGAAARASDSEQRQLLTKLAEMEDEHEATFAGIRAKLTSGETAPTTFDPESQAVQYLQVMADSRVFKVDIDPEKILDGGESPEEVIRIALTMEKDSVVFYQGLKEVVPEGLGQDRVNEIIKEEMWHITVLSRRLAEITA